MSPVMASMMAINDEVSCDYSAAQKGNNICWACCNWRVCNSWCMALIGMLSCVSFCSHLATGRNVPEVTCALFLQMGGKRKPLFSHDRLVFELAQEAVRAAASAPKPAPAAPVACSSTAPEAAQAGAPVTSGTVQFPEAQSSSRPTPEVPAAAAPGDD